MFCSAGPDVLFRMFLLTTPLFFVYFFVFPPGVTLPIFLGGLPYIRADVFFCPTGCFVQNVSTHHPTYSCVFPPGVTLPILLGGLPYMRADVFFCPTGCFVQNVSTHHPTYSFVFPPGVALPILLVGLPYMRADVFSARPDVLFGMLL